ncbi:MAG: DUF1801 domain-containing protein [Pyrinomonadaceae bacterium]|nr:DUF1801 domain-containing protein [Pyrinomonadaceae bacterium]
MAKAKLKTTKNNSSVKDFLDSIKDESKRKDCRQIAKMMRKATGKNAKMWGTSIVGYDEYHYKYESGREGDFFRVGFAPRAQSITLYIMDGFGKYDRLMAKLGNHKTGKSCLYIKRLSDVDVDVLEELIAESLRHFEKKYGKS